MIKHQMKITVRRPREKPISIAEFDRLTWFGGVEKVMVIVPEKNVQSVEIREEESDEVFGDANQGETI